MKKLADRVAALEARWLEPPKPQDPAEPTNFDIIAFEFDIRADPAAARERLQEKRESYGDGYVAALLAGIDPALRKMLAL